MINDLHESVEIHVSERIDSLADPSTSLPAAASAGLSCPLHKFVAAALEVFGGHLRTVANES
jgi:hypothetical protein